MLKRKTIFCLVMTCMLACPGFLIAQETDFTVVISDSADPVMPESIVNFEFEVANAGPDGSPFPIILDITLPMDVPVPFRDYLAADEEGRAAIIEAFLSSANLLIDDNIWNADVSGTFIGDSLNNGCAGMMVQPQELVLPAGTFGSIYFDVTLRSSGGVAGVAYTRADGEQVVLNHGGGGCNSTLFDNCGDGNPASGFPCMGPPLTMHVTGGAPISLVEDGTDPVGDGCEPLVGFPAGHVALIDRGECNFSAKADNATQAGASGVIVANTEGYGVSTPTDDSVIPMGCNDAVCHSLIITIPAAFISFNDGDVLRTAMAEGDVSVFMGIRDEDPEYRRMTANIWESDAAGTDTDPDNDRYIETTTLSTTIFIDGFESGDTTAW